MTSKPAPHNPQTPKPAVLKQLAFAFPFQRKAQGNGGASAQFTDEHDIYRLLAASAPSALISSAARACGMAASMSRRRALDRGSTSTQDYAALQMACWSRGAPIGTTR